MLQFFCPGCRAEHKANEAFSGKRAQCVRCGAAMRIPKKTGMTGILIPAPIETDDDDLDIDEYAEKHGAENYTSIEDSVLEALDVPEPVADKEPKSRSGNKRNKRIGLIALLLLILGLVYYFALSEEPKKKAAPKVVPEEVDESPPIPVVPVAIEATPAVRPPVEVAIPFTADRFMAEHYANPKAFDEKYLNRLVEVQGICKNVTRGRVVFWHLNSFFQELVPTEDDALNALIPGLAVTPETRTALQVVLGPAATTSLEPPPSQPVAGRGVTVQGRYIGKRLLTNGTIVRSMALADPKYFKKTISLRGIVLAISADTVIFDMSDTISRLTFETALRPRQPWQRYAPGDVITVTGVCSGRNGFTVRFDNCVIDGGGPIVTTAELIRDYEADLQPGPVPDNFHSPIRIAAEDLSREIQENRTVALKKYARKYLSVTGVIAATDIKNRLITFEKGTDSGFDVVGAFTRTEITRVKPDETTIGVKGLFLGISRGRFLRIENSVAFDPDDGNPNVPRLTPDYFPLKAGTEWTAVRILEPNVPLLAASKPSAKSTKPPAEPVYTVLKLNQRMIDEGRMQISLLHQGTTTERDLTKAAIKWQAKPLKQPRLLQTSYFRTFENNIELGTPLKQPPAQTPKSAFDLFTWEPYLRIGAKSGRSWTYEDKDNGNTTQTTAAKYYTDTRNRQTVQIDTIITSAKLVGFRQITTTTYAKGVGITSQKMVRFNPQGEQYVHYEEIREEPELTEKRESELRGGIQKPAVTRETAPAPRNGK